MSSSLIQANFRKTRISAHESELPMCPALAFLYMARKRFLTEKTRSSSVTHSAVVSWWARPASPTVTPGNRAYLP